MIVTKIQTSNFWDLGLFFVINIFLVGLELIHLIIKSCKEIYIIWNLCKQVEMELEL